MNLTKEFCKLGFEFIFKTAKQVKLDSLENHHWLSFFGYFLGQARK
jgi:hypothetical protein